MSPGGCTITAEGLSMNNFKKSILLLIVMGVVYLNLEIFMRAMRGDLFKTGFHNVKWISLAGWTSLWMFFIGGFSGLFIGFLNEEIKGIPNVHVPLWVQCLIGTFGVFLIELSSGFILNVQLKLNIWTYEGWPLNIMGQITLLYIPLWFLLVPFVIWLDDIARHLLFQEEKPGTLISVYKKLFKGQ